MFVLRLKSTINAKPAACRDKWDAKWRKEMKNLLRAFSTGLIIGMLGGCSSTTSVVMMDPGRTYPVAANTQLLLKPPERPTKQIAILESRGRAGTPTPELLENMRQKGQEIGADAVIPVLNEGQNLMHDKLWGSYQAIRGVAVRYE
jgi:hypothetical protein